MQTSYYLQKLIEMKVSNEDDYLGVGANLSPEIIKFMSLKQETTGCQNAGQSGLHAIKLDEHELAMAS